MAIIKRSTTTIIGLDTELAAVNLNITAEANARQAADGVLTSLTTTAKGNLVAAINEVNTAVSNEVTARVTQVGNLQRSNGIDPLGMGSDVGIANGFHNFTTHGFETVGGSSATDYIANVERFVVQEANERVALANNLQQQITNILSNTDATALNSLSELVTAFQNADSNLNNAITTLADTASTNLANEATARTNADTEIKNAIANYSNTVANQVLNQFWDVYNNISPVLQQTYQGNLTPITYTGVASVGGVGNTELHLVLSRADLRYSSVLAQYMWDAVTNGSAAFKDVFGSFIPMVLNSSTIRTIIDGQTYDLEGEISTFSTLTVGGTQYKVPVFVSSGLSAADLTFFAGKTFTIQVLALTNYMEIGLVTRQAGDAVVAAKDTLSMLPVVDATATPFGSWAAVN